MFSFPLGSGFGKLLVFLLSGFSVPLLVVGRWDRTGSRKTPEPDTLCGPACLFLANLSLFGKKKEKF